MTAPRIALIGAGAVGGLVATALTTNRHGFHWVVRNPDRRRSLAGLKVFVGKSAIPLVIDVAQVVESVDQLPADLDLVIVAVKVMDVQSVLVSLGQHRSGVLVIANGLLSGEFQLGLLYGGARLSGDELKLAEHNRLCIGDLEPNGALEAPVCELLATPWLQTEAVADIAVEMWHKLALNCAINPLSALLDCVNGGLPESGEVPLIRGLLAEVNQVAEAVLGGRWCYSEESLCRDYSTLIQNTALNSSSMREDLRAGRVTEIGMLNLAVDALGAGCGLDCPLNRLIGHMIFLQTNKKSL